MNFQNAKWPYVKQRNDSSKDETHILWEGETRKKQVVLVL